MASTSRSLFQVEFATFLNSKGRDRYDRWSACMIHHHVGAGMAPNDDVVAVLSDSSNLSGKAVALAREGDDVPLVVGCVAQSFPQQEDVLFEVRLLDERVWPQLIHQDIFGNVFSVTPNENQQRLECLWSKGYGLVFA